MTPVPPQDQPDAPGPAPSGGSRRGLWIGVGVAVVVAVAVVVGLVLAGGGDGGEGDGGSALGEAIGSATTTTAGNRSPVVTRPRRRRPPATPGRRPVPIRPRCRPSRSRPSRRRRRRPPGSPSPTRCPGGNGDLPLFGAPGRRPAAGRVPGLRRAACATTSTVQLLSLADDGIGTHIEVFAPDGSSEGIVGRAASPASSTAWSGISGEELPATGTYVIRVIHTGGSHEPFALGFFGTPDRPRPKIGNPWRTGPQAAVPRRLAVLGLPPEVRACLFDLDGVLTRTASVHAAAWGEMFDEFLADPGRRTGEARPFDARPTTTATSTAAPGSTAPAAFLASRGIELPEGTPDDPPGSADRERAEQPARTTSCWPCSTTAGVEVYEGSVRLRAGGAGGGAGGRGRVVERQRGGRCSRAAGIATCSTRWSTARSWSSSGLAGKPAPDMFLDGRPPPRRVGPGGGRGVRGRTRRRGGGRAGGFALVVGVDRVGQADELLASGADIVVRDLSELLAPQAEQGREAGAHQRRPGVLGRAVERDRARAAPRCARPHRVGVRPVQRSHRPAGQPRRGRSPRPAGHLPELGVRAAPAARTSSAATATPSRARRSSTSPTAS